jgi:hypothetical protein
MAAEVMLDPICLGLDQKSFTLPSGMLFILEWDLVCLNVVDKSGETSV